MTTDLSGKSATHASGGGSVLTGVHSPAHVFGTVIKNIGAKIEEADRPRGFKDRKLANSFRQDLFELQAWARIHRGWKGKQDAETFSSIRDQSKALEDLLGRLEIERSLLDQAKGRNVELLAEYQEIQIDAKRKELKALLRSEDWMPREGKSRTERILSRLERVKWLEPEAHSAFIGREIAKSITEFENLYDSTFRPEMAKKQYDHHGLETAVHEWRRQIRWFAIYFQTGRGLFALGERPKRLNAAEKALVDEYENSPYTQLPVLANTRFLIDPIAYYRLTKLIQEIGEAKDSGEFYFFVFERLRESGAVESQAQAEKLVRRWYGDVREELPKRIHSAMEEFERTRMLSIIRKSIEAGPTKPSKSFKGI